MKGKILALGIIRGEDGNRYSFSLEDIQNLGSKDENSLINCEVDFEIEDSNAKSIFITKSNFSMNSVIESFGKDDLNSIKIKAYIYVGGTLLSFIPILGEITLLIGFVFLIAAILSISRVSGIALLKNLILTLVFYVIGAITLGTSLFSGIGMGALTDNAAVGFSIGLSAMFIGFIFLIAGLVFNYFYYKGLAQATNEKFFFYVFICRIIGICTLWVIGLGIIFIFAGQILELVAWVKFKELKKAEN